MRHHFFFNIGFSLLLGAAAACFLLHPDPCYAGMQKEKAVVQSLKSPQDYLLAIRREVVEMGPREGEDFIKKEFDFDLDGNRANREEHILVLIHKTGGRKKLLVQVTTFKAPRLHSLVKYACDNRQIRCEMHKDVLEIKECGYTAKEIAVLLPKILSGIRTEKEWLKLADKKKKN